MVDARIGEFCHFFFKNCFPFQFSFSCDSHLKNNSHGSTSGKEEEKSKEEEKENNAQTERILMSHRKAPVSKKKAKTILREGKIRNKKISEKQKGLFGAIAGGVFGHPVKINGRR